MNLLPLEVLPGWPEPAPISDLHMWLLMLIGPLAFGAVVTLIAFAPRLARGGRDESAVETRELEAADQL